MCRRRFNILQQVYAVLKPLGHAIWVLKGYVRDGHIVDLPHQWQRLCEYVGFVTLHEHRALLVDSHSEMGLFGEAVEMYHNEYKSFFRRDNEQNGSPRIDYEIVLCMQKPACNSGGKLDFAMSSPPYADRCANDDQRRIHRNGLAHGHNEGDGATYGHTDGQLASMPTGEPMSG